jgi:hypothetical protein
MQCGFSTLRLVSYLLWCQARLVVRKFVALQAHIIWHGVVPPPAMVDFYVVQLTLLHHTDHVNLQSPPVSSAGIEDGGKRHDFKATPFESMG